MAAWFCVVAPSALAEKQEPQPGSVIAAGDIRARNAFYSVVFYFSPEPKTSVVETVRALLAEKLAGVPLVTDPKEAPQAPFVAMEREAAPLQNYPVPEAAYLERWGIGIKKEQAAAVQETKEAVRLILIVPRNSVWDVTKRFTELASEFAHKTGAFIWDSATRQCFSPDAWRERRIQSWTGVIPDLSAQITIHAYRQDDGSGYVRAITLGMEKFALPDLVVQQLLASEMRSSGNLINVAAQLLSENPVIENPADYRVSLVELKDEVVGKTHRKNLLKGATEEARLALVVGRQEEGDPDNTLVELDFRHGDGRSNDERRQATFAQIWGAADTLINVWHNDEIRAASQRAKAKLPELQKIFAKGLAPGERIILKAPFPRDDEGNEWMWVEVMKWSDEGKVTGILENDPYYVKKLRAGSRVLIKPEEVFDYLYYKADGTEEGNETGRLMQQQRE